MGGTEIMQDIGPDMDDLLRRAAEGYPLREPADDWDKIASRLPGEQATPMAAPAPVEPKKRRRFLWLLLLLLPTAGWLYTQQHEEAGEKHTTEKSTKEQLVLNKNEISEQTNPGNLTPLVNSTNAQSASGKNGVEKNEDVVNRDLNSSKSNSSNTNDIPVSAGNITHTINTYKADKEQAANQITLNSSTGYNDLPGQENAATKALFGVAPIAQQEKDMKIGTNASLSSISNIESHLPDSADTKKVITSPNRTSHFYYNAIAGVGFSSVKHYGVKKANYDIGLMAGYQFNKTIALEAGIFAAQKYYMSRGDDFNTDGLGSMMQPGIKMMEVAGSSQVLAIPLHAKFNLNTNKGNRFFIKSGVSSFIMTKESNDYYTMNNGNPEMIKGIYKKDKNYLAASIDFAAGYEQQLKGNLFLRIEPYIQIPIRNVGIGDLPVTSAGLHIGISWPAQ